MLRWLKRFKSFIAISESTNSVFNAERLIHDLIGWEVSMCASEPDREEIEQITTKHSAITVQYITEPMKTQQLKKARIRTND